MKIDLHCHSYYSDGISSPYKLIKGALKKGLDGIAITDHGTMRGWREVKKTADNGLFLIPGEEISTKQGDILALFLRKEINGEGKDITEVAKEIKNQKGIVIIPHPFNRPKRFEKLENYLDIIDGIEVLNARWPFVSPDKKALSFAKHNNLAMTGGSDAHYYKEVGYSYTRAENAKNLDDFKNAILKKQTKAEGKKAPLRYLSLRPLAIWGFRGFYLRSKIMLSQK
ncbi:MAG: metal-dependent phosphoesterase [Candidatus Nealsonbacteria bacterium CG_4_10_14_0_2_um_filter_38_17]|uniref:Metal-dependent phosphoesterase n=2 Tax=Candidatus Nealsoniibacteriota TaxID=1817911 RepID=A0A2M7UYT5_9BACT|nr:MAG: metal-dependent phosphoesterase [Candidatus Nealsonbacteria bacterium CG23_combo_of_CG06-09_8_20_14_all_38_19]PIZ89127.1 MAG: metal-dependent phosphoesterase [Candidatus Nealsonbacteria bacterium CG_4_10_14_0_2_um_filter_38_17]